MAKKPTIEGVPQWTEEVWVYAGRVFYKGSLFQRFMSDAGKGDERIYKQLDARVIGGLYKVSINQGGQVKKHLKYDGPSGHPLTNDWLAQDVKARGEKMIMEKERRDQDFRYGAWTLDEVNQAYLKARGRERAALLAFIVAYVMNEV